jgi:glycosyltransferase involved in cell wall biosynthesis
MKTLHLLPELNSGGVEQAVFNLATFLARDGHECVVVSNGGRMVADFETHGVRHIALPVHRKSLFSLRYVSPLLRLLAAEKPDVLHLHSRLPAWLGWLAWRGLPPESRPALVTSIHGFFSVNAYSAIMMRGERVIAVSESIRDYILANYPRTSAEVIRVIPPGIALENFPRGFTPSGAWRHDWEREFQQLRNKQLLTLPGRLTRLKGHAVFLQLLAALRISNPSAHGLIVGGAHPRKQAYREELEREVERLGLTDAVTFTGQRADLREILAVSAIVFSLSTQPESFGLTTLEALALGRPVIGTDHGGVGEQLRRLFSAGLVPPGDGARLIETTRRLLATPATPEPVPPDYTLEHSCRRTLDVYSELRPGRSNTDAR